MKILLIMDPGIPVPPTKYGGIERIVAMLAREYRRLGHDVHVLASAGSSVEGCTMHTIGPDGFPPGKKNMDRAVATAWRFLWANKKRFDLIQNFGRLLYLLPVLNSPVKKIMCYQREITARNANVFYRLPQKNLFYCACSENLLSRVRVKGNWAVVPNGVDFSKYTLREDLPPDAPLIFLGRIEKVKGCHTAIAVAKATGNKLIIAGNISTLPQEIAYYKDEIEPQIDGTQIIYIGELNDAEKNEWLGKAKALLMPIEWNEPFGIVMVEAMACGTPVIAFRRGASEEVIENNVTGLKVNNKKGMVQAVGKIQNISRRGCREKAESLFGVAVLSDKYLGNVSGKA